MSREYHYEKRIGLSFSIRDGRITIYRSTLELLEFPEFYRFLYYPEKEKIAIEACGIDDKGAHRMPKLKKRVSCDVKSMAMVRLLYRNCGWNPKVSYRVLGKKIDDKKLVDFDLSKAEIIKRDGADTKKEG